MKKPKTVIDAEAALTAKAAEVAATRETLKRLEAEHAECSHAVRNAMIQADAGLPQCRLVYMPWRGGAERDGERLVILRRTPGGMLIARRVGDASGCEFRFKLSEHAGKYRQAEKGSWTSDTRELRDVPAEYLPTCQAA